MTAALHDVGTVDRARAAARAGHLDEAVRLLDTVATPTAAALDLRARVHAQRGELDRADKCWAQALLLDPGHSDARRGREAVARLRTGRPGLLRLAVIVAALVVVGGLAFAGFGGQRSPAPSPMLSSPSAGVSAPAGPPVSVSPTASAAERRLTEIASLFTVPGARTERRTDDVRLLFTVGIFSSGTQLADGSGALLDAVGRQLPTARVTVTVVGHTVAVPGGRSSGGSTTAYARAQTAARFLAASSGLPLTDFTLATADQSQGPWPEAPRNRTVTLLLHPVG